jgi:hypothetical protein
MLVLIGWGCSKAQKAEGSDPEQPEDSSASDDSGWVDPGVNDTTDHAHFACDLEDPDPSWSLEEVGERLQQALGNGMPNPVHFEQRYTTLLFDQGDLDCPGGHGDGDDFFNLHCTTPAGYTFEGIALRSRSQFIHPGLTVDMWSLSGDFSIGYPDDAPAPGHTLKGAGGISSVGRTQDDALTWTLSWNGSWSDSPTTGWMAQGISVLMDIEGGVTVDNRRHLTATGGLAIGATDLYLDGVGWDEGGPCSGKTTGSIGIRDPSGHWYSWAIGSDCDGCGPLVFSGTEPLGELCLDLSHLEETAVQIVPGKYTVVVPDTGTSDTGGGR